MKTTIALAQCMILFFFTGSVCHAQNPQPPAGRITLGQRCVQHTARDNGGVHQTAREAAVSDVNGELRSLKNPTGPELIPVPDFMPAGGSFKVAINEPYDSDARYFGYVERSSERSPDYHKQQYIDQYVNMNGFLEGGHIGAVQIPDDDPLVKSNRVAQGATLLTVLAPSSIGGLWSDVDLYIWRCGGGENGDGPRFVSEMTMAATSPADGLVILPLVLVVYLLAAIAAKMADVRTGIPLFRYLDPVYMTAGPDGKGSISKLQILFFSLIVFGLLSYFVVRTGALSDLSPSILLLLGIAGVGSAAATGTDEQRNRISYENQNWLIHKGWLPVKGWAAVNKPSWHDIITNDDGEFDVYRYQSCIFSLAVGGALLLGGVDELDYFTIPPTLLGVLGLSQAVYLGGKLVSKSSASKLNDAISKARESEKLFADEARKNPDPDAAAGGEPLAGARRRAGDSSYANYIDNAKDARTLFEALTGRKVADKQLEPTLAV